MEKKTTNQLFQETPEETTLKKAETKPPKVENQVAKVEQKPVTHIQRFQQHLDAYEHSILPSLLKKHNIDAAQFKNIVLSEIKKNEKLLQAFVESPSSMFASILAGAEIGLIPSDIIGDFYLIPRKIDGKMVVTPQVGYKGIVNILLRSGEVTKVHAECVYDKDEFKAIYGLEQNIVHVPNLEAERSAKTLKYVYAVAKLKNGDYQFTVLTKGDIIKISNMSRYNNALYFNDDRDPNMWMVKKTALIQLSKMLPKDYYGKKAVEMENQLEGGAMLILDENNEVKIVDGKKIVTTKYSSVKNTLNQLPDIPE